MDSTVGFRVSETNWFSCGAARRGKGLMAIFLGLFASTSKIFVLVGGGWALGYHFMGFRHFPNIS